MDTLEVIGRRLDQMDLDLSKLWADVERLKTADGNTDRAIGHLHDLIKAK